MKRVIIIYWRFLKFNGSGRFLGGIETYISNLSELCVKLGYQVLIFQCASEEFLINENETQIYGIKTPDLNPDKDYNLRKVLKHVKKIIDPKNDLIIFGNYTFSDYIDGVKTLAIQHGVAWDQPIKFMTQKKIFKNGIGEKIKRYILRKNALTYFKKCQYKVCVDYNFLNWYRTYFDSNKYMHVILNSADIAEFDRISEKLNNNNYNNNFRILFARRFEEFRGSKLIVPVVENISKLNSNIKFTIAGSGTDESFLRRSLEKFSNVTFLQYNSEDASKIVFDHDISIIPSFGSEGTSFSVAEAMGQGTAVISTDAGGITNMILDNFNGLIVNYTPEDFITAIMILYNNPEKRKELAYNAYKVAKATFSKEIWEKKWEALLKEILC